MSPPFTMSFTMSKECVIWKELQAIFELDQTCSCKRKHTGASCLYVAKNIFNLKSLIVWSFTLEWLNVYDKQLEVILVQVVGSLSLHLPKSNCQNPTNYNLKINKQAKCNLCVDIAYYFEAFMWGNERYIIMRQFTIAFYVLAMCSIYFWNDKVTKPSGQRGPSLVKLWCIVSNNTNGTFVFSTIRTTINRRVVLS